MKLKIPPVLVLIVAGFMNLGLSKMVPALNFTFSYQIEISWILAFIGGFFGLAGIFTFIQHRTTVDPVNIDKASELVTDGIYRISRNPMYVGMLLLLIGWTEKMGNPLGLLGIIFFVAFMNLNQIIPEEGMLEGKFGASYKEYCSKTRRWL